jgi:hypothetical protein
MIYSSSHPGGRRMCPAAFGVFVTKDLASRRALVEGPCGFADRSDCYVHGHARGEIPRTEEPADPVHVLMRQWDNAEAASRR